MSPSKTYSEKAPADTLSTQEGLCVSAAEAGMKLLRFLERRLEGEAPRSALHKWIRTGQVRVNKGRSAPYRILEPGDIVRVPPFASVRPLEEPANSSATNAKQNQGPPLTVRQDGERGLQDIEPGNSCSGLIPGEFARTSDEPSCEETTGRLDRRLTDAGLTLVAHGQDYMVLAKPGGLPVQSGSGVQDCLVSRLKYAFASSPFVPAPAHRLDRHTSGLVAVGLTHQGQRRLHALFRDNGVHKTYLAWVQGTWPWQEPVFCCDFLHKGLLGKAKEGIVADPLQASTGQRTCRKDISNAHSIVVPVRVVAKAALDTKQITPPQGTSLLMVALLSGYKHQIRVQLSSRGFPIIGDGRYGGPGFDKMLLHAYILNIPDADGTLTRHSLLPFWNRGFAPDKAELRQAENRIMPLRHTYTLERNKKPNA